MQKIVPIVEGDGEETAVPNLLHKVLNSLGRNDLQIDRPLNAKGCTNLIKPNRLEGLYQVASSKPMCAAILILLDADDECAITLAKDCTERLQALGIRHPTAIVLATREYEAWFLASLATIAGEKLDGRPGLPAGLTYTSPVENLRGVKEWLTSQFSGSRIYKETQDQLPMTRLIDMELARAGSRSFQRLCHAMEELVQAIDEGTNVITPAL